MACLVKDASDRERAAPEKFEHSLREMEAAPTRLLRWGFCCSGSESLLILPCCRGIGSVRKGSTLVTGRVGARGRAAGDED